MRVTFRQWKINSALYPLEFQLPQNSEFPTRGLIWEGTTWVERRPFAIFKNLRDYRWLERKLFYNQWTKQVTIHSSYKAGSSLTFQISEITAAVLKPPNSGCLESSLNLYSNMYILSLDAGQTRLPPCLTLSTGRSTSVAPPSWATLPAQVYWAPGRSQEVLGYPKIT